MTNNDLSSRVKGLNDRLKKALGTDSMPEMAFMLLQSAVAAHLFHFQTRSFSEHAALNAYYDGIPDLVDSLVEAYQGKYGLITNYPNTAMMPMGTPLDFMRSLKDGVASLRQGMPQDSELQNQVDEIALLINSTIYKLTFLA